MMMVMRDPPRRQRLSLKMEARGRTMRSSNSKDRSTRLEHLVEEYDNGHGEGRVESRFHNETEDVGAEGNARGRLLPHDLRQLPSPMIVDGAAPPRVGSFHLVAEAGLGGAGATRCDVDQRPRPDEVDVLLDGELRVGRRLAVVDQPVVSQAQLLRQERGNASLKIALLWANYRSIRAQIGGETGECSYEIWGFLRSLGKNNHT